MNTINTNLVEVIVECAENPFEFQSVSVTDIASFATGLALSPEHYPMPNTNREWFAEWTRKKIAYLHDLPIGEVHFDHFDMHPCGTPDGFYFTTNGRWYHRKDRP
jgi:hypothetical protein